MPLRTERNQGEGMTTLCFVYLALVNTIMGEIGAILLLVNL
jgi:hypothetical protein